MCAVCYACIFCPFFFVRSSFISPLLFLLFSSIYRYILHCFASISLVLILFARFVFVHYPSVRPNICTFGCTAAQHSPLHIDVKTQRFVLKNKQAKYTARFFFRMVKTTASLDLTGNLSIWVARARSRARRHCTISPIRTVCEIWNYRADLLVSLHGYLVFFYIHDFFRCCWIFQHGLPFGWDWFEHENL